MAAVLSAGLMQRGTNPARAASITAPAGLDIGAITSDEIALSIPAGLIVHRRRGRRERP